MSKPTKYELSSLNESILNVVSGNYSDTEQIELHENIYKDMAKVERKMELLKKDLEALANSQTPEKVVVLLAKLFGTAEDQKKAKGAGKLGGVRDMSKADKRNATEILNKFKHIYWNPGLAYKMSD